MGLLRVFDRISLMVERLRRETQPPTLRLKLGLMMLVPLVVIGVFAAGAAQDKLADRSDAREMQARTELVWASGELVHQLQRERGLSAMVLASSSLPSADLQEQRVATDHAHAQFDSLLEGFDAPTDARFVSLYDAAHAGWERLLQHRSRIDTLETGIGGSLAQYTALIEQHLDLVKYTNMMRTGEPSVAPLSVAYSDFLLAKEHSALIRDILEAAAVAGTLSEEDDAELGHLIAVEQAHLHTFLDRTPTELLSLYWAAMGEGTVQQALELRSELLTGNLLRSSTDGRLLFDGLSGHIDALLAVERQIVDLLVADARGRESAAASRLALIAAGGVLSLVLCFAVLALAARSIASPMGSLAQAARRIAVGDLEAATSSRWAEDPIGAIGLAFDDMRQYHTEMAQAAENLAWGNLDIEVEPRSPVDTLGESLAAMTRRLSLGMQEAEFQIGRAHV